MKKAFIFAVLSVQLLRAENLTTTEAAAHIGETATVCGQVTGMHATLRAKGQPAFLDMDGRFPLNRFTVIIWGKDQPKFGNLARYTDQHICAQGTIRSYRGKPEMVLRNPEAMQ